MSENELWPWAALFLLGAYHGINPGMGWLFAVALGLQERTRAAVLRALPPIALGHLISIGAVLAILAVVQSQLPYSAIRYGAAAFLFAFGLYKLARHRHPRWVGMQVGFRDLTLWSFLMATAHGAGLMLVPVVLGMAAGTSEMSTGHAGHMASMGASPGPSFLVAAVGVHSLAYLGVLGMVAFIVYEKLGLKLLRRAWFNLDLLWAVALMGAGAMVLAMM
jgi:hypothetical protein